MQPLMLVNVTKAIGNHKQCSNKRQPSKQTSNKKQRSTKNGGNAGKAGAKPTVEACKCGTDGCRSLDGLELDQTVGIMFCAKCWAEWEAAERVGHDE